MANDRSSSDRVVITDAHSGASNDLSTRQKRYAITMAFRTACFIGLFFVPGAWKWVLGAGAVFLPYVGVLFANQADKGTTKPYQGPSVEVEPLPQLDDHVFETITVDPDDIEEPSDRAGRSTPFDRRKQDGSDRAA